MPYNIRFVATYPETQGGIATFTRDLATSLNYLTSEIGHITVTSLDKGHVKHHIPVDMSIEQKDPDSWVRVTSTILERASQLKYPTVIVLEHEYGLDPRKGKDNDDRGHNYVNMAKRISQTQEYIEGRVMTLVYLHTVLSDPNEHQKETLQNLAKYSDGLVVTTDSAVDMLTSSKYGIDPSKIKKIHHGIRKEGSTQGDRLDIKKEMGLEDTLLYTTLGLLSPGKGIQYAIPGYAKFAHSLSQEQRDQMLYVIGGACHENFIRENNGKSYKKFMDRIEKEFTKSELRIAKVDSWEEFVNLQFSEFDIVRFNKFLNEGEFDKLYNATNGMILAYLEKQQVSSGILADTLGYGRVAIATKNAYSVEMLNPRKIGIDDKGIIGLYDPLARGILIDRGRASIKQIALALTYLTGRRDRRVNMEKLARQLGTEMSWHNSALSLVDFIRYAEEMKTQPTHRGAEIVIPDGPLEREVVQMLHSR